MLRISLLIDGGVWESPPDPMNRIFFPEPDIAAPTARAKSITLPMVGCGARAQLMTIGSTGMAPSAPKTCTKLWPKPWSR